jgi:FlaA1/EpsC-like NDP-sugar epimerase
MTGIYYIRKVKFILQIGDLIFLNLAFIVASIITTSDPHILPSEQTVIFLVLINFLWIVLASISKLYHIRRNIQIAKKIFMTALIISLHCLVISCILKNSETFNYDPLRIFYFYIFTYCLIITCKITLYRNLKYFRKLGYKSNSVVILSGRVFRYRNRIQQVD